MTTVLDATMGVVRVVGRIRRIGEDGLPVEPVELGEVDGEATEYAEARDRAAEKVPPGWQVLAWVVPEHLPD